MASDWWLVASPLIRNAKLHFCVLCVLCGSVFALDREAFTFSDYKLNLQIDPLQHALAVTGTVILRNDSATPQKNAVLQISSSLDWQSIKLAGKPVLSTIHPYESDVDHTGSLSEAVISFQQPIGPAQSVTLEVAYAGKIEPDGTRLERIGTPKPDALASDWDGISSDFTAFRGAGYVAWYPISQTAVNLDEPAALSRALWQWRWRERAANLELHVQIAPATDPTNARMLISSGDAPTSPKASNLDVAFHPLATRVPILVLGEFQSLQRGPLEILYFANNKELAQRYSAASSSVAPLIKDWFGELKRPVALVELPAKSQPYESGPLFFESLQRIAAANESITAAHQLAHSAFVSSRPWLQEGLAHFAGALSVEQRSGRSSAAQYLNRLLPALVELEKANLSGSASPSTADTALTNSGDDVYTRDKAIFVFWMLRDLLGDSVTRSALAKYKPEDDKEPSYFQRLLEQEAKAARVYPKLSLEQFFDDWVYRDRGLPEFSVASTYTRKLVGSPNGNNYGVTVTVQNSGNAGAEVPVTITAGERERATQRLVVPAKAQASVRLFLVNLPQQVTINDGSVPEMDMSNNSAAVSPPAE